MSKLTIPNAIVSVEWLKTIIKAKNLVILDASIGKVTNIHSEINKIQIPTARFFDIKHKFSISDAPFPNTFPSIEHFEKEARNLGVNNDSAIVVYDDKGLYSSARAWWMFKAFGHTNVAVLNGGLPEWIKAGFETEEKQEHHLILGDFKGTFLSDKMCFFDNIKKASSDITSQILDARSEARFKGEIAEPREGLRSGTIPNSKNLPFTDLIVNGKLKPTVELQSTFSKLVTPKTKLIFSCGSGITACVLALAADIAGYKDLKVYDGSWTEYGSLIL